VEFDYDGYVWLHGRADEVMNAGGYRVSPAEVERCLLTHPHVADAAVANVQAAILGQLSSRLMSSCAMVALSAKPKFLAICAQHLASYKRPRSFWRSTLSRATQWQNWREHHYLRRYIVEVDVLINALA